MTNQLKIASTAIVCEEAILKGDITIGENTIIHPKCEILALAGPIVIGDGNVLEEGVRLENLETQTSAPPILTIGNDNLISCGSTIRARLIGNANLFEPYCVVAIHAVIGSFTVIGAKVCIAPGQMVPDAQILIQHPSGSGMIQRTQKEYQLRAQKALLEQYIACFSSPKSRWYMGNFHHLL